MCKFLDGAKSEILKYDVISFDIFDTLLLRPFIKPTDLFLYIETKYNIKVFIKQGSWQKCNLEKSVKNKTLL
ncbi:hypothetical protein VN0781_01350 [Helicobacter pylori]